ncbi:metallophosphoesterase [Conyzicola sp.]|uniref:metallophosphoesterase n=1 Tax=Conyzicola sp. TaxID=1969404 RepID=UPI003988BB61
MSEPPNALQTDRQIGLLGDVHGDLSALIASIQTFAARNVRTIVVLGDFGYPWPHEDWNRALNKISRRLAVRNMTLLFLDGNHDWLAKIEERFAVDAHGLRWLRRNIVYLTRGFRTTLRPYDSGWPSHAVRLGKVLAVIGGANSIDRDYRTVNTDWWPEESLTEEDLVALGSDHVDVLLGHDAPLNVPDLDRALASENSDWPPEAVAYAEQGRRMFHRGFVAVRPELYVGAHYHRHVDQVVTFGDDAESFRCRVVVLDQNEANTVSLAVLDTATLQLEFFTRGEAKVERLTMRDQGRWNVRIKDAMLAIDLDARTVERRPMAGARKSPTIDRPLPLLNIRMLHTATIAILTLDPVDDHTPYWDYFSPSLVEKIERMDDDAQR